MANLIKVTIQLRCDTSDNWEQYKHVVPANGEPCFVIDKNVLKIGDGITTFDKLESINGAKLTSDGKSIVLENDIFKLYGFDEKNVGAQPRIAEDGSLEWFIPSTEAIEVLRADIDDIKAIVGSGEDGTGTLLSRIECLETKMDGTGEGTVDEKINAKFAEFTNVAEVGA